LDPKAYRLPAVGPKSAPATTAHPGLSTDQTFS